MAVDYDKFLKWAESRFSDVKAGNEIKVNSVFCEDYKHHLWCNVNGGKKERPNGVFHCYKSGKVGSLITLVMLVDKCTYDEACETLDTADMSLADAEKELEKLFANPAEYGTVTQAAPTVVYGIDLPPDTHLLRELPEQDYFRMHAEMYLKGRRLPLGNKLICRSGDYGNRIVIPYYDREGRLIYYNGRYLGDSDKFPRYMGPIIDVGIGKGDVVYMTDWPELGSKVYFTEGELDADSLAVAGFHAGALGGKEMSEQQVQMVFGYLPVICLDNDEYGKDALPKIGERFLSFGFQKIRYVRPPVAFKDWNKMLEEVGPKVMRAYVLSHEKTFDPLEADMLRISSI